ncbi:hypothetical protein RCH10_004481 [Variovorax sp. GrIS 2.14]|uniref:zeta toxin family protein n=1 Tax=Variovorax sp. GrIS 2.14 TaxID=3071709 RepID=UPI0038F68877
MTSTGPNLRFRIARELAKRAHDLSKAAGIHLPSLIRSMVTFMRVENSSPDQQDSVRARFAAASNLDTYEPRYWAEMTPFLDAEVAIAMLHQTVADATTWLANTATEGKQAGAREEEVQRVTSERAEACSLLRKFDPEDGESVARVFERFRTSHDKLTAAAPNQIGQLQLSKDELDAIYEHRIRPDVLSWGTASSSPAAVLVVGQAGAAVLSTAARLRRQITLETGEMVVLSDDRLRPYHPAWRTGQGGEPLHAGSVHSDIDYWFERIVNDAGRMGMHLQIAMEPRNPLTVHRMAAALRDGGYTVQAVFVVTHSDDSALDATAQFERVRALGLPSRFVLEKEHDMGLFNFRLAVGVVEQYRSVDELQLVSSDAREHHGNSLLHGEWHRPPTARTALDALQKRMRSPK